MPSSPSQSCGCLRSSNLDLFDWIYLIKLWTDLNRLTNTATKAKNIGSRNEPPTRPRAWFCFLSAPPPLHFGQYYRVQLCIRKLWQIIYANWYYCGCCRVEGQRVATSVNGGRLWRRDLFNARRETNDSVKNILSPRTAKAAEVN